MAAESAHDRAEFLAVRFAAKEAVLKALGTGWSNGIAWTDIEVVAEPTRTPQVRLYGRAAEIANEQSIETWMVSLSRTPTFASATAMAFGAERDDTI